MKLFNAKLFKMEQTRHVYEDASNQLGYIFELFSNQLALSPYGNEVGRTDGIRGRSRTMASEEDSLSSIQSLQSRRKSTSCTNTQNRKPKPTSQLRSTSTDCASDTSSMSQAVESRSLPRFRNRRVGREEKFRYRSRTLDSKYKRHSVNQELYAGYGIENVDLEHDVIEDDIENALDETNNQCKSAKKKSNFGLFLSKLKTFLIKENKYDLKTESYEEHSATLGRYL